MAVVKANAYGHGLVSTALCLADADAFAVARLEEAIALRAAGIRQPIVLLEGVINAEQLAEAAQHDLELVVHEEVQLRLLEQSATEHRFVLWLKVDTGMNRLGFRVTQFADAYARVRALRVPARDVRALTHFASADDAASTQTAAQQSLFAAVTEGVNIPRSLANSAAVFAHPTTHAQWIRPGLALYGVSPFEHQVGAALGLQPAMRLVSTVIAVRNVTKGESVGYAATWRAQRDSQIAIVAAGYGDGLPRSLPNGSPVKIGARQASLVGRVSMDMLAVDITGRDSGLSAVQVGDEVVLWGPEQPVEELAAHAGTIAYELLCGVSQRVPLRLV
jgi:alanine racemase